MAGKRVEAENGCIDKIRHSKVKVTDKGTGKVAILLNPAKAQVRRIQMDRCLAPPEARAADFVVSMPKVVDVIVELKGTNVAHAVDQIESTWTFWSSHPERTPAQVIGAWILCSEYPRASLKVNRYRESFRSRGAVLLISTHNGEERSFADFLPKRP